MRSPRPSDDAIFALIPSDGDCVGIGELAKELGCKIRDIGPPLESMAKRGRVVIERPPAGYFSGERQIRRAP